MTDLDFEEKTTKELRELANNPSVCEEVRDLAVAELARRY